MQIKQQSSTDPWIKKMITGKQKNILTDDNENIYIKIYGIKLMKLLKEKFSALNVYIKK